MSDDATPAKIVLSAEDKTGPAYQSAIANMKAFMAQTRQGAGDFDKFSKGAQLSSQQVQGLVHSVRAFADQVLAGQSPIRAFGLEVGKLSGTFGGTGKALDAILGLLTPARVAFGALAASVAAVGVAFFEGSKEAKAFADALTLSGNFAGQTAGKFDATAKQIADNSKTLTVGDTRSAGQALAATGEVGPEVFAAATEASARFSKATGKTADDVAKDFASMTQDVAKWATEHNRSLNFITAAQLQQIKVFQDSGREVEAQKIVYEALNERLRGLDDNLGLIDSTLNSAARAWSNFWEQAKGVGKADTAEDRIKSLRAQLAKTPQDVANFSGFEAAETPGAAVSGPSRAQLQTQLENAERDAQQNVQTAFLKSQGAANQKAGIGSNARIDALLAERKDAEGLSKALEKLKEDFDAADRAGTPRSASDKAAAEAVVRKKFAAPNSSSKIDKADLDQRLRDIKSELEAEQANLKFSNEFLRGLYSEGEISLKTFYDEQAKEIDEGARKKIEALQKERDATADALSKATDPARRIALKSQIGEIDKQIGSPDRPGAVDQTRSQQQILLIQQRTQAFKALADSVRDFNAQLDAGNGDEHAAELKTIETTMQHLKVLADQSRNAPPESGVVPISDADLAKRRAQLTLQTDINEAQRQFALLTAQAETAEQRLALQQSVDGKGLLEHEDALHALREKSLDQLAETIDRVKALAAVTNRPEDLQHLDELILKYEQLKAVADPRKLRLDAAADNIGDTIADGLGRAVLEGGKLSDVLKSIGTQVAQIVTQQLVTKPFGEGIADFIKGSGGKGFGENLLGLVSGLNKSGSTTSSSSKGEGLNTGSLSGAARSLLFDHDTSPATDSAASDVASSVAAAAGTAGAATASTAALTTLATAAAAAAEALAAIAATSGTQASVGGLKGLFGGGSAGGTEASDDALALFFHDGGVAGRTADMRKVPAGTFKDAPRFHEGAVVGGEAAAVNVGEIAAVLQVGEELIGRSDPRHADNGGELVIKRAMQNAESIAALAGAPGQINAPGLIGKADKKVAGLAHDEVPMILRVGSEVLKQSDPRHSDQIAARIKAIADSTSDLANDDAARYHTDDAVRYHTGGIVGEKPTILKIGEEVLAQTDPRHRDNLQGGNDIRSGRPRNGGFTLIQQFAPGATQKTTGQAAVQAGREFARANGRGTSG